MGQGGLQQADRGAAVGCRHTLQQPCPARAVPQHSGLIAEPPVLLPSWCVLQLGGSCCAGSWQQTDVPPRARKRSSPSTATAWLLLVPTCHWSPPNPFLRTALGLVQPHILMSGYLAAARPGPGRSVWRGAPVRRTHSSHALLAQPPLPRCARSVVLKASWRLEAPSCFVVSLLLPSPQT